MFEGRDGFEVGTFFLAAGAAVMGTAAFVTGCVANSRCSKLTTRVENVEALAASHDDKLADLYMVRNSD